MPTIPSIPLFRLFGFLVGVHPSWFLVAMLLIWTLESEYFPAVIGGLRPTTYWLLGVAGTFAFFASVVLHDLGHRLAARMYGIPTGAVTLFMFGGVSQTEEDILSMKSETLIAAAGSGVSAVLAAGFGGLWRLGAVSGFLPELTALLGYLAGANLLLAIFNLLPAYPLDGGRVLRAYLWRRTRDFRSSTGVAAKVGSGCAVGCVAVGVLSGVAGHIIAGMWLALSGVLLFTVARASGQQSGIVTAFSKNPIRRFMNPAPVCVPAATPMDEFIDKYVYQYHHRMFPVINGGRLFGRIEVRNIRSIPRQEWSRRHVWEFTDEFTDANSVSADSDALQALELMKTTGNTRLLVREKQTLLGIVTLRDLLEHLTLKHELEPGASFRRSHFENERAMRT